MYFMGLKTMNLIKQLNANIKAVQPIKEDAAGGAVGAGAIAVSAMPLLTSLVKRTLPKHPRIIKYSSGQVHNSFNQKRKKSLGLREAFYTISEDMGSSDATQNFDSSEVLSKLKSLEDKESVDYRDTATFGLVDSNGAIVRVTVPTDQSQGFEQDIQHFMTDRDESDPSPEIAEVLFKMKDRYTIINVEWPEVEEDQEESQELPDQAGAEGADQMPGAEGDQMPGAEGELPGAEAGMGGQDTGQVTDLLTQVIDMMKADAEARKAEAQAREAEAKTKQAGAAREQAMARVKQEEQFMDMDEYTKSQKTKEKEAKRLAQLAKWKHDMAKGEEELPAQQPQYDFLPGEEENEELFRSPQQLKPQQPNKGSTVRGRVNPADVAKYIMSRAR